jgi:hypothetical protein
VQKINTGVIKEWRQPGRQAQTSNGCRGDVAPAVEHADGVSHLIHIAVSQLAQRTAERKLVVAATATRSRWVVGLDHHGVGGPGVLGQRLLQVRGKRLARSGTGVNAQLRMAGPCVRCGDTGMHGRAASTRRVLRTSCCCHMNCSGSEPVCEHPPDAKPVCAPTWHRNWSGPPPPLNSRLFPFASSTIAILFELSSKATDACARDVGAADGAGPLESLHDGVIGRG